MKENKWLEQYAPPGIEIATEKGFYMGGMIGAIIWSMSFLIHYLNQRSALFVYKSGVYQLREDAMIATFEELMEFKFLPFYFVMLCTMLAVIYHYMYHYRGSHMMYLMKRLPDKMELHRRCFALPLLGTALAALCMFLLKMLYYSIYVIFTPAQCLPV